MVNSVCLGLQEVRIIYQVFKPLRPQGFLHNGARHRVGLARSGLLQLILLLLELVLAELDQFALQSLPDLNLSEGLLQDGANLDIVLSVLVDNRRRVDHERLRERARPVGHLLAFGSAGSHEVIAVDAYSALAPLQLIIIVPLLLRRLPVLVAQLQVRRWNRMVRGANLSVEIDQTGRLLARRAQVVHKNSLLVVGCQDLIIEMPDVVVKLNNFVDRVNQGLLSNLLVDRLLRKIVLQLVQFGVFLVEGPRLAQLC